MRNAMEELVEYIEDYEHLSSIGKEELKDLMLEVGQKLVEDGVEEGWRYSTTTVLLNQGDPLPVLHSVYQSRSLISQTAYALEVKEIVGLEWKENGCLLVKILGQKKTIKEPST